MVLFLSRSSASLAVKPYNGLHASWLEESQVFGSWHLMSHLVGETKTCEGVFLWCLCKSGMRKWKCGRPVVNPKEKPGERTEVMMPLRDPGIRDSPCQEISLLVNQPTSLHSTYEGDAALGLWLLGCELDATGDHRNKPLQGRAFPNPSYFSFPILEMR